MCITAARLATLFDWPGLRIGRDRGERNVVGTDSVCQRAAAARRCRHERHQPVASFVLGILAFDAPAPRDPGVLSAIAVSGVLIAVGIVGLANASSTRRLYRADAGCGERAVVAARLTCRSITTQADVADHGCHAIDRRRRAGHRRICRNRPRRRGPLRGKGAQVLVHGRDPERTDEVADEVGGRALIADLAYPRIGSGSPPRHWMRSDASTSW